MLIVGNEAVNGVKADEIEDTTGYEAAKVGDMKCNTNVDIVDDVRVASEVVIGVAKALEADNPEMVK